MATSLTVKIYFTLPSHKQEIRRWTVPQQDEKNIYPALIQFLHTTYSKLGYPQPLRFLVQYLDEDSDLLTVSSEVEMQEGLALNRSTNGEKAVWKLLCRFDESPCTILSGLSTPQVQSMLSMQTSVPPSPSLSNAPSSNSSMTSKFQKSFDREREEEATLLDLDSSSDDEYERIEEDSPTPAPVTVAKPITPTPVVPTPTPVIPTPIPTTAATPVVAEVAPTVPTPQFSFVAAPVLPKIVEQPKVASFTGFTAAPAPAVVNDDSLDQFMQTHPSAPAYRSCRLCAKLFQSRSYLVDHLKTKHGEAIKSPPRDLLLEKGEQGVILTPATVTPTAAAFNFNPPPVSAFPKKYPPRLRAEFISDVTIGANGKECTKFRAGERVQRMLSIVNSGQGCWPVGTKLVFEGDKSKSALGSEKFSAIVPDAGPGDVVHLSIHMTVPPVGETFQGTFYLCATSSFNNLEFGQRIRINLAATKEEPLPPPAPVKKPTTPTPSAPPAQPIASSLFGKSAFLYGNQLATIQAMGFKDIELCKYLLLNNHGDVQKVVSWLLANCPSK